MSARNPPTPMQGETGALPIWRVKAGRFAGVGITLSLSAFLLAVLAFAAVAYTSGVAIEHAHVSAAALTQTRLQMDEARDAERGYRLTPNQALRARFRQASEAANAGLSRVMQRGGPSGREGQDAVALGRVYADAAAHLFAAVDAGNPAAADAIARVEVSPVYAGIVSMLQDASGRAGDTVAGRIAALQRLQRAALAILPALFIVCAGVAAFFWNASRACARRAEESLARQASAAFHNGRRFRSMVQNAPDLILVCDAGSNVVYQNVAACRSWSFAEPGLLGLPLLAVVHPEDQELGRQFWERLRFHAGHDTPMSVELRFKDGDGCWRPAELSGADQLLDPSVEGVVITVRDDTHRKAYERQLASHALYDKITRLPNRLLLEDRLEQALLRSKRMASLVGVIIVELAGTASGRYPAPKKLGDDLLVEAVWRLKLCVRAEDTVALAREDRLVVIVEGVDGPANLLSVATRVGDQFSQAFRRHGRSSQITWNVGLAISGPPLDQVDGLIAMAEAAVERARSDGSGQCVLFDTNMHARALDRLELESDLRNAVSSDELSLQFQPVVEVASGRVRSVEALLCWRHPVHGPVAPREFQATAENVGLIVPLGKWALEASCRQVAEWQEQLGFEPPLSVAINLSAAEFRSRSLVENVAGALRGSGLPPGLLTLQVTESLMLQDLGAAIETLWKLKGLGVQLAMSDFGTGSSSLSQLRQLPLDLLKIGGSAGRGIPADVDGLAKVQASVALARSIGFRVLVEGVDTAEQARLLASWGCDFGQGRQFGEATETDSMEDLLYTQAARSEAAVQATRYPVDRPSPVAFEVEAMAG